VDVKSTTRKQRTAGQCINPSRTSTFIWRTHNRESLMTYTNWGAREPNNNNSGEVCMHLWKDHTWADTTGKQASLIMVTWARYACICGTTINGLTHHAALQSVPSVNSTSANEQNLCDGEVR